MLPMKPAVMLDQVRDFPTMTREQLQPFEHLVHDILTPLEFKALQRIFITGDGDSFHAAHAAEMAFENIAHIPCEPMSAQRFVDYGAEWMPVNLSKSILVIGISASGRTPRVVQSLERARARGVITVALTGTLGSAVTQAAEHTLVVKLPDMGPSPGLRTYNATLLGLLLLAIRIGEIQQQYQVDVANAMRQEIAALADVMAATIEANEAPARAAAEALRDAQAMVYLGSGPSYGTALFSSAKMVEAAGLLSVGQDLEEWWHVERFAYPRDMPTVIIAPPGRSHWRAIDLARTARELGRRIIAVVKEEDTEITQYADWVFPVKREVREEFSPLVYHIGADLFASFVAEGLGRMLFQSDDPARPPT